MGHRLSKIYTRTGDDGTTGLGDGSRTGKDSARVDAFGTLHGEQCPQADEFILPGGGRAAAACHLARTVCRRAERGIVALGRESALNPELVRYVNRLSDYLVVAARVLARAESGSEVLWRGTTKP